MDIAKPLSEAFNFVKSNPVVFIPGVIVSLVSILSTFLFLGLSADPIAIASKIIKDPISYLISMLLIMVVYGLVNIYSSLWIINLAYNKNKYDNSLSKTAYISLRVFPIAIAASVLQVLIVVGGMILLIIPGIFLFVKLVFVQQAVVIEKKGIISSLKYSWNLVSGRWWETFAFVLILGVLLGLLSLPNTALQFAALFNKNLAGMFFILSQAYSFIYTAFTIPFSVSAFTFFYFQMKNEKPKNNLYKNQRE